MSWFRKLIWHAVFIVFFLHFCEALREGFVEFFFAGFGLFDEIHLLFVFFEQFDAQVFVLCAKLLVKLDLWVIRHEIPDLDASLLAGEGERAGQVLDHPLVKVALVHKDQPLRCDQAEEDLVEEAKLREGEEKDASCQHYTVLYSLCFVLSPFPRVSLQQWQAPIVKIEKRWVHKK